MDQGVARLLSPARELEATVVVRRQVSGEAGGAIEAEFEGEDVRLRLVQCAGSPRWGSYTGYEVVAGPPALMGKRVADVDESSVSGGRRCRAPEAFRAEAGERLYLTDADRAATKDIIAYDLLPDSNAAFDVFLEVAHDVAQFEDIMNDLRFEPSVCDAVRFSSRLRRLPGEKDRLRERLRRLGEQPLVRALRAGLDSDRRWGELWQASSGKAGSLYNATRAAMLRALPELRLPEEDAPGR